MATLVTHGWLGYLSSTGVYGDAGGAWVDESADTGGGRRTARAACGCALAGTRRAGVPPAGHLRAGPQRIRPGARSGRAHRIDLPGQVFSRVHVDDIVSGRHRGAGRDRRAPTIWRTICPTSQNAVIEEACRLLGVEPPPLLTLEEADLSPMARGFYAENRRVANGKAKRVSGMAARLSDLSRWAALLRSFAVISVP